MFFVRQRFELFLDDEVTVFSVQHKQSPDSTISFSPIGVAFHEHMSRALEELSSSFFVLNLEVAWVRRRIEEDVSW